MRSSLFLHNNRCFCLDIILDFFYFRLSFNLGLGFLLFAFLLLLHLGSNIIGRQVYLLILVFPLSLICLYPPALQRMLNFLLRRLKRQEIQVVLGIPDMLIIVGASVLTAWGIYSYVTSPEGLWTKLATGAVVIGLVLLLASAILDRLGALRTDRYREIQR